jgi:hypothetical protein
MSKLYITCVKRSSDRKTIEKVGIGPDMYGISRQCQPKEVVAAWLAKSLVFVVVNGPGSETEVHRVQRGDTVFLSTNPNETTRDNLDGLPECIDC